MDKFLKNNNSTVMIDYDEVDELVMCWTSGDKEIIFQQLMRYYDDTIKFIVNQICKVTIKSDVEYLRQEAYIGLINALNTFDCNRGIKFHTYANKCLRTAILDSAKENIYNNGMLSRGSVSKVKELSEKDLLTKKESLQLNGLLSMSNALTTSENTIDELTYFKNINISTLKKDLPKDEWKLLLALYHGYTHNEVANELGLTRRSISYRVSKLRTKVEGLI